jgi:hypothetical protein
VNPSLSKTVISFTDSSVQGKGMTNDLFDAMLFHALSLDRLNNKNKLKNLEKNVKNEKISRNFLFDSCCDIVDGSDRLYKKEKTGWYA